MIIYTDRFIPDRFGALTIGPITFIRPTKANDFGLKAHEEVHRHQFWSSLMLPYTLRRMFSKKWSLRYEAEAYAEQLEWSFSPILDEQSFITMLVDNYGFGITREEAKVALDAALARISDKKIGS
jgi:hypothetical protein